jgi:hypothetical protein
MPSFALTNRRPFRLVISQGGRHCFGGPALHSGVRPPGSDVAIQLVIALDLSDPLIPISSELNVSKLPLYYPFKYGIGGSEIQYAIRSDSEIEILHMSDAAPDEKESQYLHVDELPTARLRLEPLTYEQARILGFMSSNAYFQPSVEDQEILEQLDVNRLIEFGGPRRNIVNAGDVTCRNPACEFFGRRVHFDSVVLLPPIPINGEDGFWHEFQGGDVTFCFGFCCYCGTVIAFNVAS